MGGIGLSAAVLAFIALPGMGVFFYSPGDRDRLTKHLPVLSRSFSRRLINFILTLFVVHGILVAVIWLDPTLPDVDLTIIGILLVASPDTSHLKSALENIQRHSGFIWLYPFAATGLALLVSRTESSLIEWYRRHQKPNARQLTHWFELMIERSYQKINKGKSAINDDGVRIFLSVTIDYDAGTQLVSGFYEYVVAKDNGQDVGIAISNAVRRDFQPVNPVGGHAEETEQIMKENHQPPRVVSRDPKSSEYSALKALINGTKIPGSVFLIKFENVHTVNITFMHFK